MFSYEYYEFFKNNFFTKHFRWLLLGLFFACGSSRLEVFCKKGVLRNFAKFTGKHKKEKMRLWRIGFPLNFVKLFFLQTSSSGCFCAWLSYHSLYPFSHILSQPLTGYLPFHFPVENIIKWTLKTYIYLIYHCFQSCYYSIFL